MPSRAHDENVDDVESALKTTYLTPPHLITGRWLDQFQFAWDAGELDVRNEMGLAPTMSTSAIRFVRHGLYGQIVGYRHEVAVDATVGDDPRTSMAMTRASASRADFVRGRTGHLPFTPGGVEPTNAAGAASSESVLRTSRHVIPDSQLGKDSQGLYTLPPGLQRGLRLGAAAATGNVDEEAWQGVQVDGKAVRPEVLYEPAQRPHAQPHGGSAGRSDEIDDLLPAEESLLQIPRGLPSSTRERKLGNKEWAHVVDVNTEMDNFSELVPEMAITYPFELDNFQKEAVYHLERGESVFVAAHTSAGKTVVAEYAIALANKHLTRTIYTSPIKALSNQKFRDFKDKFEDVGILTGDVQINADASCLVMTTEILRSMLYRGADIIRDVEFVIFDEVHYVNDQERGVVWEEVIIMLPAHVTLILLSATVPNTREFAGWVGRTKQKDIYVISTAKRPVPLEHYVWAGRGMFKVVDSEKRFLQQGFKDAAAALRTDTETPAARGGAPGGLRGSARGGKGGASSRGGAPAKRSVPANIRTNTSARTATERRDTNVWSHVVGHLQRHELLPAVVFVFSKRRCDDNADSLASRDLNTKAEKNQVFVVVERSLARLKEEDRRLPQIIRMRELLARGVAVHHGGLLPIVKEIVELLFARGLVKVLFATETFAMGVNMPARTVVFSGVRKHDGRQFRDLLPGEYTQMAGRAGRRGLDRTGTVIIVDGKSGTEVPEAATLHQMILGTPNKLLSQFRLTYNMILNLLRVETLRIEDMIKRSFSENATQRLLPQHQAEIDRIERMLRDHTVVPIDGIPADALNACHDALERWSEASHRLYRRVMATVYARKAFCPGRMVYVRQHGACRKFGVVVAIIGGGAALSTVLYEPLAAADREPQALDNVPLLGGWGSMVDAAATFVQGRALQLESVRLDELELVTAGVVSKQACHIDGLRDRRAEAYDKLHVELSARVESEEGRRELDWLQLSDFEAHETAELRVRLQAEFAKRWDVAGDGAADAVGRYFGQAHEAYVLAQTVAGLRHAVSNENLELLPEYGRRIAVLQEMGFVDAQTAAVLLKGRVACEIHSAHELILTELILENTLAEFEPEEIVALLSAFVFEEKSEVQPVLSPHLERGKEMVLAVAKRVQRVQERHGVVVAGDEDDDFERRPRFHLMQVTYEWARGMTFRQIMELTDVPEGSIVRAMVRLDEVLRECKSAARTIGDARMAQVLETCREQIRRDVIWAPSLYM